MNAPATPGMLADLVAELLPIQSIRPSQSAAQKLRRARYNAEQILALAANVQQVGVMQPILVRPVDPDGTVKYEIVAGERRWLASDRAGLGHVPAIIRTLDDSQALELQLSENIQRESIHPLEEAEGFHELMQARKITADQLGDIIGKSRSYIYARTKLRDLCPEARDALAAGTLDASKALLLARIRADKLQKRALQLILQEGQHYSYKRLFEKLRDNFMTPLAGAPFALADTSFFYMQKVPGKRGEEECIAIPACAVCPHNSANDRELLDSLSGAHVCTDTPCFESKVRLHWKRKRDEATADGRTILTGDEAKKALPDKWHGFNQDYLDLDARSDLPFPEPEPEAKDDDEHESPEFQARLDAYEKREQAWEAPTFRALLGDQEPYATILVEDAKGRLREVVPIKAVRAALKEKGVDIRVPSWMKQASDQPAQTNAELQAENERVKLQERIELTYRTRLFTKVAEKWKGPLKRPDLDRLVDAVHEATCGFGEEQELALEGVFGSREPDTAKMKDDELMRYIILFTVVGDIGTYGKPGALLELAERYKIDPKKIRADVTAELKPKPAAAPKPAAPQPKAAAKPAKKKAAKK